MDASDRAGSRRPMPLYLLAALTLAAVLGVSWSLDHVALGRWARLALALVPVGLWSAAIILLVRAMRALDELQRRIHLEALAIAFPCALMLGMTVEYLQKAGFAPGLGVGEVWPAMALLYVPALAFAHWRYR